MTDLDTKHVVIVGGGTAGITVAAALVRRAKESEVSVTIVEPSENHYYQPAFTLVGAGIGTVEKHRRDEGRLIPRGVEWERGSVTEFDPEQNRVKLSSGTSLAYDYLVVCPGLVLDWDRVAGAGASLGRDGVCSNYCPDHAEYTWDCIQHLQPGARALFTQPPLPFKCPGAPQKIAYLAADHLKRRGILEGCNLHFLTHADAMFAVPLFAAELKQIAARYGIQVHYRHKLVAVDGKQKKAIFETPGEGGKTRKLGIKFDMLHITPPQTTPAVVQSSKLANEAGFVEVHPNSLRHVRYGNIFGLGDAASTPNSKTAAAIRKQAPVVVKNLLALVRGGRPEAEYDGYASCPLTTALGKVIMAEFIYGGKVTPTFPLDPRRERRSYWWVKTTGLPLMYWYYMLKGHDRFLRHDTGFEDKLK